MNKKKHVLTIVDSVHTLFVVHQMLLLDKCLSTGFLGADVWSLPSVDSLVDPLLDALEKLLLTIKARVRPNAQVNLILVPL